MSTSITQATPSGLPRHLPSPKPTSKPNATPLEAPRPKLRLQINDLRHPASKFFLNLIPDVSSTLETALTAIIEHLYTPPRTDPTPTRPLSTFTPYVPATRSVTVLLRDIDGVAYTTGTELDNDHKEIHLSLSYIRTCTGYLDPVAEITGVLTHELVHCYQHTAPPQAQEIPRPPGGLIEGIADFVRLKAGLEPPHWKRPTSAKERSEKWDQGYQHTAYFLAWLEDVRVGKGAVGLLNDRLLRVGYVGEDGGGGAGKEGFWKGLFGVGVQELWEDYGRYLDTPIEAGKGDWEDEIVNRE
ncbi:basic secretory family protein [Aspergillus ibericus CBS 121593]|uniref:Plant basic secretory protein n=1 Tax=Aspergillus ibericus CBS 121593 TaxID=1448316 RepID=A0A395GT11_9EURO|nr:plant basic secretory protein [Aspergillus ibericus CBS 121593]RAK98665.1 plant basic secretory protein [Aspergillus ibericus CBS 121593]